MMIGNILDSGGADKSDGYEETVEAEEIFSCDQKLCHRFSHLIQIFYCRQHSWASVNFSRWMFLKDAEVIVFENDKGI